MLEKLRMRVTGASGSQHEASGIKRDAEPRNRVQLAFKWIGKHLNFFRIHLLYFILVPLVFSGIFHRIGNGQQAYIDCFFLCVSAMTVTGLNPLLMQDLSSGQHAICMLLSTIGSTTGISLIAISIRQYFFLQHFQERIAGDRKARAAFTVEDGPRARSGRRLSIHRIGVAVKANNAGEADPQPEGQDISGTESPKQESFPMAGPRATVNGPPGELLRSNTGDSIKSSRAPSPPRRQTTRIVEATHGALEGTGSRRRLAATKGVPHVYSLPRNPESKAMVSGLGGFSNPFSAVFDGIKQRWLESRAGDAMPRTTTFRTTKTQGGLSDLDDSSTRPANYITFDALVGRNSRFLKLTSEQKDELGGVEYRALSVLWKIVLAYILLVQLIPMAIFCPIFGSSRYSYIFADAGTVSGEGSWYTAYNVNSAFANAGLSLLDASMIPFQETWGWVMVTGFLILAGNTAFPVFLRLVIWTLSKMARKDSKLSESLHFLLDHPRRCFFYLFPAYQTWFLVIVLFLINGVEWLFFAVLNQGLPVHNDLSVGARAMDGLFQSIATRAAGFAIVPLSSLAPAFQVLMVLMMYISVYPIAVSIRASNVYEEKSLGVYHGVKQEDEFEALHDKSRRSGAYFVEHARRQLAFDGWWLLMAVWLICIVERANILEPTTDTYFNTWTVIFEIFSGYGSVGLSLGVPYANFSLCGAFRTLSKLILCAVMIRGRQRGLPVAIDRSILLPSDIAHLSPPTDLDEAELEEDSHSRSGSVV